MKLRIAIWSPFMQSYKKKYPWVQLAGHAGMHETACFIGCTRLNKLYVDLIADMTYILHSLKIFLL